MRKDYGMASEGLPAFFMTGGGFWALEAPQQPFSAPFENLFLGYGDGRIRRCCIKDDDMGGCVSDAFAPVPGVDHFHNGFSCGKIQHLAFFCVYPELA